MIDWIAEHAGVIGLLFFVTFFSGVVIWVFRPGSTEQYKADSQIPLKENEDDSK
ncbi:MAG: cbb3-type cytochrome c oxidase subunit 3 [Rhodospirillales bacterium]|nr:cbb3-type cytochrome c oxidase subunit 3 [Rhodospirillales bacterium]